MKYDKIILFAASLLFSIVLLEVGLRLFTLFPLHGHLANRNYDTVLAYRMSPTLGDIDEAGFRNPYVPEQVDIVTLGDSHTYGFNVKSEESWPQQLAAMTDMTVYNLGVGGYGSLQYHHLMDRAIAFNPQHIILGLYVPNDMRDAWHLVRQNDYWNAWANERGYAIERAHIKPSNRNSFIRETAIGSLVLYVLSRFGSKNLVANEHGESAAFISYERISRLNRAMDLSQKPLSIGLAITREVIEEAKRKSDAHDVHFYLLFIPSKERVFFDYLLEKGYELPAEYHQLVEREIMLIDSLSFFATELRIPFVDAKPLVLQALDTHAVIYPYMDNGHPFALGYEAYAKAVHRVFDVHKSSVP